MEHFQYVMVTNWADHWDNLQQKWNNSTIFTISLVKDDLTTNEWPTEANTLFIKRNQLTNEFEKSWIGKAKNFRKDSYKKNPAIRFEISDLTEISCSDVYKDYAVGWHLNKSNGEIYNNHLEPAFFQEMSNCNALTFELHCFRLLRLLGIHDLHKFPQNNNKGKADGFFHFQSLAVIYDATVDPNFIKKKNTQIENYINQLKKEEITFDSISHTLKHAKRLVWIITRGNKTNHIKTEDNITAREIPYTSLVEIYHKRLNEEIGIEDLCDILKALGK